ncbi:hAT transposon superfamily [Striga asiatica]|uniref:HAT transposon superfamily n=1 Tax=Striga asiatica TaxID=4170 RepID=A0A5A7PHD5_STRAF|nr:hAT transposon superfamily [Striga asiatica]
MLSLADRLQADIQLNFYDNAQGKFGSPIAKKSRRLHSPAKWWERFGSKTPELMRFAIRVLSLTCKLRDVKETGAHLSRRGIFDSLLDLDKRVDIDVDNEDQNYSPIIKKKRVGESSSRNKDPIDIHDDEEM